MPDFKVGPLSRAEIQSVWEGAVDKGYRDPFLAAGEGRGFEVWTQYFAQLERASQAIDVTTQAMYISPWSGQTNPPAAGAANALVTLTITRTKLLDRLLVLGKGLVYVGEQTTDSGEGGGVTVITGRRYVLQTDLVFHPGERGPFTVVAAAEFPGYGFNNPLPGTISYVSQPGSSFTNTAATVTTAPRAASASRPYTAVRIAASVSPDMFVPEHDGQYLQFLTGANAGSIARLTAFGPPTPGVVGSSMALELHYSAALTGVVGAFQTGEALSFSVAAFASLVAFSAVTGRMAFVLRNGTPPVAGVVVTGTTSGATGTISSVLFATAPIAEVAAASWKVLDWAADWGLTASNAAKPSGGLAPFLDEIGGERGIGRSPGELDVDYRARVREIADVVSPNAIKRAMNRAFAAYPWTLREVGSVNFPGFFFDATDAYDVDVLILAGAAGTGTFMRDERVVLEDPTTRALYATGRFGRIDGGTTLVMVRNDGALPAVVFGSRLRGLSSGATWTPTSGSTPPAAAARLFRTWLDYEQFRGFFDVEVLLLGLGEFGWAYDSTLMTNAYDVSPLAPDGYPAAAAVLYQRIWNSLNTIKAGGVGFQLVKVLPYVAPPAFPVPTLSLVATAGGAVGDIGGSYAATLTGSGYAGTTPSVLFGLTAATSVVVVNDSTITCVVPAHATGVVSVSVTTAGGSTAPNTLFEFYSPAQEAMTSLWRGAWASPEVQTASAGTSGSNGNLTAATGGVTPLFTTLLNGIATATYDGIDDCMLNTSVVHTTLLGTTAFHVYALIDALVAGTAAPGSAYTEAAIICDDGQGWFNFTYSTRGVTLSHYDLNGTGLWREATVACAPGQWHLVHGWYDGANLFVQIDGAAPVTGQTVTAPIGNSGATVATGRSYAAGTFLNGRIAEIGTSKLNLGATFRSKLKSYVNTRYNLTL